MMPPTRATLLSVVFAAGCGGNPAASATTTTAGDQGSTDDCEPGRCLEDVSARVNERRAEARACYDEGVKRIPELQGRLIINYEIDPDGTVVDASQSAQDEQITDEEVVACVEDVIRQIKFPASRRGKRTRAFHRYEFNPAS